MKRRKSLPELLPHSLGKRLFFIICIVGVILVISLGITVSAVAGTSLYNSEKEKLVSESKQIINVFDQYIEILENTAMAASRQRCIQKLMSDPANDFEEYVNYRDAYSYIRNVHEYYTGIHLYIFFLGNCETP